MESAIQMNALNKGLFDTLKGGTALTNALGGTAIYNVQAPDNAVLPYVVFSVAGGGDENITPSRSKNILYYVRAYSKTSAAHAGTIDGFVDTLLHGKSLSVTGWSNFWLARETDVENVDNEPSGEKVWMSGGYYRVRLDK